MENEEAKKEEPSELGQGHPRFFKTKESSKKEHVPKVEILFNDGTSVEYNFKYWDDGQKRWCIFQTLTSTIYVNQDLIKHLKFEYDTKVASRDDESKDPKDPSA